MPSKKRKSASGGVTVNDVARKVGVSIKTVSRVVNREPNVALDTLQKVQQAIAELGYRPNFSARNLAGSRAYLVALIYDNPSDNYLVELQEGALSACQALGYSLILHPTRYDSPNVVADILAMVRERRPTGLLLTPPLCDMPLLLAALDKHEVPYVLISSAGNSQKSPVIRVDERRASYDVTRYLLNLGHRRIGFIQGHPAHSAAQHRLDGYREAHQEQQVAIDEQLIRPGLFTFESGQQAARELLALPLPPTAIFASNDDMAAGVLHVAHELGWHIPRDLSVAGFDDTSVSRHVWPSLTTVQQPMRQMAETAVRALIAAARQSGEEHAADTTVLPHQLIVRGSTGQVPQQP